MTELLLRREEQSTPDQGYGTTSCALRTCFPLSDARKKQSGVLGLQLRHFSVDLSTFSSISQSYEKLPKPEKRCRNWQQQTGKTKLRAAPDINDILLNRLKELPSPLS
jgi:hypothetical protein